MPPLYYKVRGCSHAFALRARHISAARRLYAPAFPVSPEPAENRTAIMRKTSLIGVDSSKARRFFLFRCRHVGSTSDFTIDCNEKRAPFQAPLFPVILVCLQPTGPSTATMEHAQFSFGLDAFLVLHPFFVAVSMELSVFRTENRFCSVGAGCLLFSRAGFALCFRTCRSGDRHSSRLIPQCEVGVSGLNAPFPS